MPAGLIPTPEQTPDQVEPVHRFPGRNRAPAAFPSRAGTCSLGARTRHRAVDFLRLAKAIAVLARAQQDAVWDRTQAANKLRSHLHEYFPGFLASFESTREGLCHLVARALLAAAATPEQAARLTRTQLRAVVRRAGRKRGIEAEADRLREILRRPQMRQPSLVEQAMGQQAIALLRQLDAACTSADDLATATVEAFEAHPDARSSPASPALAHSPEPACSLRSATTDPASETRKDSKPSQVLHRSPGPRARASL